MSYNGNSRMDSSSSLRILLAEDDPTNRKVTLLILKRLGYKAEAVGNGLQALQALKKEMYDLVLMDIVMPDMDGLEAARKIRECSDVLKQPKIIALTAYVVPDGRERCLEVGMDDYLIKPIRINELADVLSKYSEDPSLQP